MNVRMFGMMSKIFTRFQIQIIKGFRTKNIFFGFYGSESTAKYY